MGEDEDLELLLGARFSGLAEAQQYATAMERVARAEADVAKASRSNGGGGISRAAQTYAPPSSSSRIATAPTGPASVTRFAAASTPTSAPAIGGRGGGGGISLPLPRLPGRAGAAMQGIESSVGPALLRSLGGGGAGGAAAGAMGTVAKVAGPVGVAVAAITEAGKAVYALGKESARVGAALTSLQVSAGGSRADAARLQVEGGAIGATGQGARAFQDRITGSDEGRSAAAQIGISNTRAPYGSMRFGKQYMDAIERTASIADENQRQRLAYMLGIEEEVARQSKLSISSRRALARTTQATGAINDEKHARDSAEFEAGAKRVAQGWENVTTSFGKLALPAVSAIQEATADFFDSLAWIANGIAKVNEYMPATVIANLQKEGMRFAADNSLIGPGKGMARTAQGGGGVDRVQSATAQNTQATMALTAALDKLTGNIGGGSRARESLEILQKGPYLHDAMTKRAIRHGAMG